MIHTFILPIKPRSKERPRFSGGHTYHTKQYRSWQDEVRQTMVARYGVPSVFSGPLKVSVTLRFPTRVRGDLDNIFAGLADALQPPGANGFEGDPQDFPGILWANDRQIIDQACRWEPSWDKCIVLEVEELPEPVTPPKPRKTRKSA